VARAPVLAFCDVDCVPEPVWLEAGLAALRDADLVAGEIRLVPRTRPGTWALLDMDRALDQRWLSRFGMGVTANLFVRTDLFRAQGGFDGRFASGSDFVFTGRATAAGARLVYAPGAVVLHPAREDARAVLAKAWFRRRWAGSRSVSGVTGRRWTPKPIGLDAERLAELGVRVTPAQERRALAARLVENAVGRAGQTWGVLDARARSRWAR
jgi:hypothetical protein